MATKKNRGKAPSISPKKEKRHVHFGPLSADELKRASDEGALMVIPQSCACVVKNDVYGKLIVL